MKTHGPKRWREHDSGIDPELRGLLELPSSYTPTPQQLASLAARLEHATGNAPLTAARPAPGAALLKVFGGVVVLLALGLASRQFRSEPAPAAHGERAALSLESIRSKRAERPIQLERETRPLAIGGSAAKSGDVRPERVANTPAAADTALGPARSEPHTDLPPPSATGAPTTVPAEPRTVRTRGQAVQPSSRREAPPTSAPASVPARARDHAPTRSAAGTPERAAAPVPSELALLAAAQQLLAQDARDALEQLSQHARLYPRGEFAEEREALALDALRRLGRRTELRDRAQVFLAKYPRSPQRERIEHWLH